MRHLLFVLVLGLLIILPSCKYFKGGFLFGKKAKTLIMKAREDSVRVADSLQKVRDLLLKADQARVDSVRMAEEQRISCRIKVQIQYYCRQFHYP